MVDVDILTKNLDEEWVTKLEKLSKDNEVKCCFEYFEKDLMNEEHMIGSRTL